MARPKSTTSKNESEETTPITAGGNKYSSTVSDDDGGDDFASELIKQLNKEHGDTIAYNLGEGNAPTVVKRWIPTGSRQLDSIIANSGRGGLPEGRIIEISGNYSCGKSTLASICCAQAQRMGGIVVYIDTENATNPINLAALGVDVTKRFVFAQTACTEEVFTIAESAILKTRNMQKDVPVVVVWDSLAASAPKAELEGDYDQNTIGLQARVVGKGLRKIVNLIANKNVTFIIINQQRQKIGVSFGDPTTTPGGLAIPYACSTRIQMSPGSQLKDTKTDMVYGIEVQAKLIKNKVGFPHRKVQFQIHFGKGIVEHENVFDVFREYTDKCGKEGIPVVDLNSNKDTGERVFITGAGAWKTFSVIDKDGVEKFPEVKFYKAEFGEKVLNNPKYAKYMDSCFEQVFKMRIENDKTHFTYAAPTEGALQTVALAADVSSN